MAENEIINEDDISFDDIPEENFPFDKNGNPIPKNQSPIILENFIADKKVENVENVEKVEKKIFFDEEMFAETSEVTVSLSVSFKFYDRKIIDAIMSFGTEKAKNDMIKKFLGKSEKAFMEKMEKEVSEKIASAEHIPIDQYVNK
jgi:hypothetical protein